MVRLMKHESRFQALEPTVSAGGSALSRSLLVHHGDSTV